MADVTQTKNWGGRYLLLISFIEGGCLMGTELVGAKLVAPYYGNSIYVWAAVLGLTLGGLATGYFLGGLVSKKYPHQKALHTIIGLSALVVGVMPLTSTAIMEATLTLSLGWGIVLSCLVFLFPAMLVFGMVSPMIIRLLTTEVGMVGRASGTVYAVSTFGGVLFTFLFGFYLIPYVGLWQSCVGMATILAIFPGIFGVNRIVV